MIVISGKEKIEEKSEKENKKSLRRFDENENVNENVNDKTYFTPQIFYHLNTLKGYSKAANNKSISLPELITVSICISFYTQFVYWLYYTAAILIFIFKPHLNLRLQH
jgi:hypothetical protein